VLIYALVFVITVVSPPSPCCYLQVTYIVLVWCSVTQLVLEADGYQPYLLSPEKGLRFLIRKALDLAKDPGKSCVDEVRALLD